MPSGDTRRTIGLLLLFAVLGPVVGLLTVYTALLLGPGGSFESRDPATGLENLALLVPAVWGAVAYKATRRRGARRPVAALAAVLAIIWAVGSVILMAEFA